MSVEEFVFCRVVKIPGKLSFVSEILMPFTALWVKNQTKPNQNKEINCASNSSNHPQVLLADNVAC